MTNELLTVILAATPISELRGALPLALGAFDFSPAKAFGLSVFGNLLPIAPAYFFFFYLGDLLMKKSHFLDRLFTKMFEYTRRRHQEKFEKNGASRPRAVIEFFALFLFVAIPFPLTGVYSATAAAYVFGVPFRRAFLAMTLGVLAAGGVVLGVSLGAIRIFSLY